MPTKAAVSLGSNLGERAAHLDYAAARLAQLLKNLRVSRYFETAPLDVPGNQLTFLNAAAVGDATLPAAPLLTELLKIEKERGRERPFPGAARTLDLDLVLYTDQTVNEPGLVVPHPRFRERRFVLEPLAEIAPDMVDPVTRLTVRALLEQLIGSSR
jgi:2-amino-4-hydroxy-6-hydroxymethyldihydropteridine diphosphokinase